MRTTVALFVWIFSGLCIPLNGKADTILSKNGTIPVSVMEKLAKTTSSPGASSTARILNKNNVLFRVSFAEASSDGSYSIRFRGSRRAWPFGAINLGTHGRNLFPFPLRGSFPIGMCSSFIGNAETVFTARPSLCVTRVTEQPLEAATGNSGRLPNPMRTMLKRKISLCL